MASKPDSFTLEAHEDHLLLTDPVGLKGATFQWVSTREVTPIEHIYTYACLTPHGVTMALVHEDYDELEVYLEPTPVSNAHPAS